MKFHWGHGIAAFYTLFVLTLIFVVVRSTGFDNSLVAEDYYRRDLNYQQEYERRSNSLSLPVGLRLEHSADTVRLAFPSVLAPSVTGNLHLYRPSSQRYDRKLPLRLDDSGQMEVPLQGLPPGRYVAIVEWTAGETDYYDELDLDV